MATRRRPNLTSESTPSTSTSETRIAACASIWASLDSILAFDAKFGSGGRWVAVAQPDGSAVLMLIAPKRGTQEYKLIGRATQVAFVTEDVLAKFHEWRERGVRFGHPPRLRRFKYERPATTPAASLADEAPIWGAVFTASRTWTGTPSRCWASTQ